MSGEGSNRLPRGVYPFDYCNKQFELRCRWSRHQKLHKLRKCRQCNAEIRGKMAMKCHMSRHKQPLSCAACQGMFSSQYKLDRHLKPKQCRAGPKPVQRRYGCWLCDWQFLTKWDLKQHIKTVHSTEKPLKCAHCEKAFKLGGNLRQHYRSMHSQTTADTHQES